MSLPITRAVIHFDSIKFALKPGRVGYVRISTFDETTPTELRTAIGKMRRTLPGTMFYQRAVASTTRTNAADTTPKITWPYSGNRATGTAVRNSAAAWT